MENRLVDMRELYQEWKDFDEDNAVSSYSSHMLYCALKMKE